MGAAKRRKQQDPTYGQPLLYETIFFDQPHEPAYSCLVEVPRRGNARDQLMTAIHTAEKLQWCLTWRDSATTKWRLANTEAGQYYGTAEWVANQLNRKLTNVSQILDWAPELAAREVQKIGFTAADWQVLMAKLDGLNQDILLWELWPPEGGDGYFEEACLYRAFLGRNDAACKALRSDYPMAGDAYEVLA